MHRRTSLAVLLLAGALTAPAAAPAASVPISASSEGLVIGFSTKVKRGLAAQRVRLTAQGAAGGSASRGSLAFPRTGGRLDTVTRRGVVTLAGTVRIRAGRRSVLLRSLRLDAGPQLTVSAVLRGRRRAVFVLRGGPLTRRGVLFSTARGATARVAPGAVAVLNRALGVRAFAAGRRLGLAFVTAAVRTIFLDSGAMELRPGDALARAGITVSPEGSTTAIDGGFRVPFIAGPRFSAGGGFTEDLEIGALLSDGGLKVARDGASFVLAPTLQLDATPSLVQSDPRRPVNVELLELEIPQSGITAGEGTLVAEGITAKLAPAGAELLRRLLGASPPAGTPMGTLRLDLRTRTTQFAAGG